MIADCLEISVYNFLILVIWFNTNAFVEYCYILNIEKLTKAEEFTNFNIDNNISLHYTGFLQLNYDNFFTRLISCPICLCFWLNIFYLLKHQDLLTVASSFCLSLFLFYGFSLIYKKTNA